VARGRAGWSGDKKRTPLARSGRLSGRSRHGHAMALDGQPAPQTPAVLFFPRRVFFDVPHSCSGRVPLSSAPNDAVKGLGTASARPETVVQWALILASAKRRKSTQNRSLAMKTKRACQYSQAISYSAIFSAICRAGSRKYRFLLFYINAAIIYEC
jgi:hypothetical protein